MVTWMRISNYMTACSKDKIKLLAILFVAFVSLLAACKKADTNTIGANFIGTRDGFNVHTNDTTSLILYTVKHDSIPTTSLGYYLLGDMNDPILGKSKANIYTQFSIPNNQYTFAGASIDSVVLRLKPVSIYSYYGNISTPQQISVYELKESLVNSADSGYFSNREYKISEGGGPITTAPIGYFSGRIHLTDSFTEVVNGISSTIDPHIRIKLSDAFVQKMQQAEGSGAFVSSDVFKNYIKGLAIMAQTSDANLMPGQGAIVNINIRSSISAIVVYYGGGKQKAVFPITSTDVATNQYKHSTNIPLQPYVSKVHANECYVQSTTGMKTRILMPNILDFAKNNAIAIIGAEMVFTVQDGSDDATYYVPDQLLLRGSDSLGRNALILDQFEDVPSSYYGGEYNSSTRQYKFNIIRHIQNVLNIYRSTGQNINYGMNLILPANDYSAGTGRLVLNTNTTLKKVKLNLSYTVIK
jgi:major membrane immunogen (membrane-anchored lipoprotein)